MICLHFWVIIKYGVIFNFGVVLIFKVIFNFEFVLIFWARRQRWQEEQAELEGKKIITRVVLFKEIARKIKKLLIRLELTHNPWFQDQDCQKSLQESPESSNNSYLNPARNSMWKRCLCYLQLKSGFTLWRKCNPSILKKGE